MVNWQYHPRPRDWTVKEKTLARLLAREDFDLSNVSVENKRFSFAPVPTNAIYKRYSLECEKDCEEYGVLLLDILEGHRITITEENAEFLLAFAETYGIKSLRKRAKSILDLSGQKMCIKTFLLRLRDFLFDFFTMFGTLGKILMTFWDFYGVIIVFNVIINFIIMITTMGIYTSDGRVAAFILVLLPMTLYSGFFTNLTVMPLYDFFSFPFFSEEKTIWPRIQRLIVLFVKVLPTKRPLLSRNRLFGMGKWYDMMHGAIMFIFVICLVEQALNEKVVMAVEVLLILFCVGIPPIKYLLLYVVYTMHGVASWFQVCRRKFVENGDFSDPFLCSMYFSSCPWTNLLYYKDICKMKESVQADSESSRVEVTKVVDRNEEEESGPSNRSSSSSKKSEKSSSKRNENDSEKSSSKKSEKQASIEVSEDTMTELDDEPSESEKYYFKVDTRLWYVILMAILSKASAAVYVVIATIAFMIAQGGSWTAGQIAGLIIGYILIAMPLSSSVSFPWMLIRSVFFREKSDEQVKRQFACIRKSKDRRKTFFRYVTYAKEYKFLRYAIVILNAILIFWILLVVALAASYKNPAAEQTETPPAQTTSRILNTATQDPMFRKVAPATCSTKIKGFSILQLIALAQSGARESEEEMMTYAEEVMSLFFDSFDPNKSIKMYPAPFPDPLFRGNLRHTYMVDYGVHVFAIRGTEGFIDAAVDVELWASGAVYAVFFRFVPILGTFGRVSQDYNDALLALPKLVFKQFSLSFAYLQAMTDYVKSVPIAANEDAIIAGHSLGGGLAKLASLETGYQGVGVSGPGTHPIRYIFKKNDNTIRTDSFISINPQMDVVAAILGNEGSVFSIPCRDGSFQCHNIWRAMCQTSAMCGSIDQHRKWCRLRFTEQQIQEMIDDAAPHIIT